MRIVSTQVSIYRNLINRIDVKVVTTLHGTDITLVGSHPTYKTAVEFSINNSDVVTAVSNNLKETTNKLFNIRNEIQVVYNFIDTEKYDIAHQQKSLHSKFILIPIPSWT